MLAGRGVACLGGATVDRLYRTAGPVRPGTSNPAVQTRSFGGVARNVAEGLARLGAPVALVSVVGADESGRALLAHLAALGVDVADVEALEGAATAEYVAVTDPSGELALGLADMGILAAITPDFLAGRRDAIGRAALVFADCNLPAESLGALLARRREGGLPRLAVDAVSVSKAARLPADLAGVDLLFLNEDEARAMLGAGVEAARAAQALRDRGAGAVVLTRGPGGVVVADAAGVVPLAAAKAGDVVDVTGAGDALVAATLRWLLDGAALDAAVRAGLAAAALTLAHRGGVRPDLSPALLERAMREADLPQAREIP